MFERLKSIAFVTPEATPFIKTGGLGDVSGELPPAIASLGIEVYLFTLAYDSVVEKYDLFDTRLIITLFLNGKEVPFKILTKTERNVTYYFLYNPLYIKVPYYGDKLHSAIILSEGALKAIEKLVAYGFIINPPIIHANDWQTALIPLYLKCKYYDHILFSNTASILTIHNAKYRADWLPKDRFWELGIDYKHWFGVAQVENQNFFSLLRGGIFHADKLNTVSPTHRNELLRPEYGETLVDLFRKRADDLVGIMNGVDYEVWKVVSIEDKEEKKLSLQRRLGFEVNPEIPFIGMIARIAKQKSVKLVVEVIKDLLIATDGKIQFIFVGKGNKDDPYNQETLPKMLELSAWWSKNVRFIHDYTTEVQKDVYSGIDLFLYPSEYEPCGTKVIVALINGVPCVVRKTGGLADNVQEYNKETGGGNGFLFDYNSKENLFNAIGRALELYEDKKHWQRIIRNSQSKDRSWTNPAKEYLELYKDAILKKRG